MATYDLGKVVGDAGAKGDNGSTVWNTSTAPTYANSKYTFTISTLSGKTGLEIAVNDIIFYSTYYYIVSTVNSTTVDCTTRVSIKGSDASVTIVDNLTTNDATKVLSAKQGKVLNDNKVATSSIATSWGSPTSDSKVPSEKLTKDSLDAKQATLVSGTNIKTINNNSILGSGNIDISSVDIATSWGSTLSDTKVPSEKLTKNSLDDKITKSSTSGLVKNDGTIDTNSYLTSSALSDYVQKSSTAGLIKNDGTIDTTSYSTFSGSYNDLSNKPTIPSKISDLTNDSNFIETSSTSGLIKNDGTIDTSSYITSSALSNYMQKSSTAGLMKNDGTVDTNTYLTSSSLSNYIQKSNTSGLIKNDGTIDTSTYLTEMKIGSTSGLPVKTTTSGVLTTGSFGTTSGTFAEGNHTHGSIKTDGTLASGDYKNISNFTGNEYVMITDGDDNWKIKRAYILPSMVIDYGHTFTNISPATKSQTDINTAIDTAIGGKVTGTKVTSWSSTVSDSNIPSEKLTKDSLDDKVDKVSGKGLSTNDFTATYKGYVDDLVDSTKTLKNGHTHWATNTDANEISVKISSGNPIALLTYLSWNYAPLNHTHSQYVEATKVTSWSSTVSDSNVPSEKLVKDSLPTKVSDLNNDSGFITSSAISGMLTSSDIVDNLTTNDATKVLSAKQGKVLADLIGDAITYINQ